MPLSESTALCGPRVLSRGLGITIPEAQTLGQWIASKGSDPFKMGKAIRKSGYKKVEVRENCTLAILEAYRLKYNDTLIIIDYMDDMFGATDGHYVIYLGRDEYGDAKVWNPDSDAEYMILPHKKLEVNWYDYKIDDNSVIYRGLAILAHK